MKALILASALAVLALTAAATQIPARATATQISRARNFVYSQSCPAPFSPVSVGFAVPGAWDLDLTNGPLDQVWIDLSLSDNDFAPDTFIGAGPFTPRRGALEFQWQGLHAAERHYYRLNALQSGRWVELGHGSFETINCGVVEAMECNIPDGPVSVQFGIARAYSPPQRPVVEQWLDLTTAGRAPDFVLDDGFLPGSFIGAGPFPASGAHFTWQNINPGVRHYYRVNALYAGIRSGWEPQYSGSFESLDCRAMPAFEAPG